MYELSGLELENQLRRLKMSLGILRKAISKQKGKCPMLKPVPAGHGRRQAARREKSAWAKRASKQEPHMGLRESPRQKGWQVRDHNRTSTPGSGVCTLPRR